MAHRLVVRPDRDAFDRLAADWPLVPVWAELLSDIATPVSAFPAVAGDGQQGIASPPLPDAPPPPAPAKSGVAGALRHAKRGLRHLGEKIVHP